MSWINYALKRTAIGMGLIFGASMIIFSIIRLVPGDPALIIAGQSGSVSEESVEALRRQMGLHLPVWEQYIYWMGDILMLDFGTGIFSGKPVSGRIAQRFPASLQIALFAMVFTILIALPAGIISAVKRYTMFDYSAVMFSLFGHSIPSFWLGLILLLVFAKWLNLVPPSGYIPLTENPLLSIRNALLPSITLGLLNAAVITRFVRSSMLNELNEDYIRTARAYGISKPKTIGKYALKNALIPTLTVLGLQLGWMLGGVVIVEKVFAWPGLGRLVLNALLSRNYPVVQASLLVFTVTFIVLNLIVDLLYGWLDPRIRY